MKIFKTGEFPLLKYSILAIMMLLNTVQVKAQRHHYYRPQTEGEKRLFKRGYFGVSMPIMKIDMEQTYKITRPKLPYNGPSVDTTILTIGKGNNKKIGIKGAIGLYGGTSAKLAKTSEKSIIAFDFATSVDIYNYDIGNIRYSSRDSTDEQLVCISSSIPLSIMYKTGAEATLNRGDGIIFSIGAGVCPTFTIAQYGSNGGGYFKLRSFLVSELGLSFFKVRASYYPGTLALINDKGHSIPGSNNDSGDFSVKATGSGSFLLSVLIMINAHNWDSDRY